MCPLITIIIPVYNLEDYLPFCIDSITSQGFDNYEIILMDDGSKDASWELCRKYADTFDNIYAFHKSNGGVSTARNYGLSNANGEWILFVDGDDIISENSLSRIGDILAENKCDLLVYGQRRYHADGTYHDMIPSVANPTTTEFISSADYNHSGACYAFRKSWIEKYKIRFCEGIAQSEDQNFILKYLVHEPIIRCVPDLIYHYLYRNGSAVNQTVKLDDATCNLKVASDLIKYCESQNLKQQEFLKVALIDFYEQYFHYLQLIPNFRKLKIQTEYRENWKIAMKYCKPFSKIRKYRIWAISIRLYLKIKRYKSIIRRLKRKISISSIIGKFKRITCNETVPFGGILMFHRISVPDPNKLWRNEHLRVRPEIVDDCIKYAKSKGCTFVSLDELAEIIQKRKYRRKIIAITIDDGYRDNIENGLKVFKANNVPFCIYVATKMIKGQLVFWWNILGDVVLENDMIELADGTIFENKTEEQKTATFNNIRAQIMRVPDAEQAGWIQKALAKYNIDIHEGQDTLGMTWDHLHLLKNEPLATIGNHTYSHVALIHYDKEQVVQEVRRAQDEMIEHVGIATKHFAFPFGDSTAVSEENIDTLTEMGFTTIATTDNKLVTYGSHVNALPRIFTTELNYKDVIDRIVQYS